MSHTQQQKGKQTSRRANAGGFTLIETLVAVMLLSFALLGPFALATHSLRLSREARQQLTATYLAQEAIEVAQSVRSNNSADDLSADHSGWMDGIFSECSGNGCVVNATVPASTVVPGNIWKKRTAPDNAPADQVPLQSCGASPCGVKTNVYTVSPQLYYIQTVGALPASAVNSGFTRVLVASAPNDPTPANPTREVLLTSTVTYRGYNNALRTVVMNETLYNWFPELSGTASTTPPPPPPPPPPPVTTTAATVSQSTIVAGTTESASVTLAATAALSNLIVDIRIYDSGGSNVATKEFTAVNIASGGSVTLTYDYATSLTLPAGNYSVQVGVWSSDWSTTYLYDTVQSFTVISGTFTMGETTVLATDDSGNGNLLIAQDATLSQTGIIQSLSFYVTTAAGQLRLGVFDATGPGGGPGAKKAETNAITPVVGWNTVNVVTPVTLTPGTYWLAYLPSDNALAFRMNPTVGSFKVYNYTFGPLPATYSTTPTSGTTHWSLYATLSSAPTDTTAPSTPTGLTTSAVSPSQINLSWTASTDNVGVTGYRIERCVGAGCSTWTLVTTTAGTTYNDTGLAASTVYSYHVRAIDAAGNTSAYSAAVTGTTPSAADTTAPSAPTGLTTAVVSSTQINLSWTASTDNIGVTGYRIERCVGAGCATWTLLATTTGTTYNNTGLTANTSYSYRARATDAAGNLSAYSSTATAVTPANQTTINMASPASPSAAAGGSVSLTYNWLAVPMGSAYSAFVHFVDTTGATVFQDDHIPPGGTTAWSGTVSYARTVTVPAGTAAGTYPIYAGLYDTTTSARAILTPGAGVTDVGGQRYQIGTLTVTAPATSVTVASSTISKNPLVAGSTQNSTITIVSNTNLSNLIVNLMIYDAPTGGNLIDLKDASPLNLTAGVPVVLNYVSAPILSAGTYYLRIGVWGSTWSPTYLYDGAVRSFTVVATDTTAPTAPTGLTASPVSSSQINLSWTASTDNVGVTGYEVERCTGSACTPAAPAIATPAGVTYNDTGLAAATTYRYRVRARDAAGNLSTYSTIVSGTTPAAVDATPPSAPTNLTTSIISSSQINLSWTASSDNVGVTGYRLERCSGVGCSSWAQIATPAGTTYNDTGLTANTSYSYRVRATDAAANLSAYSSTATAVTPAPPDTTAPSTPTNLTTSVASASQINLSWTASTDNVGVTGYRIERCSGAGCATWTQLALLGAVTTYNDTGLAENTSYSYHVRAIDAAGNTSLYSTTATGVTPWSSVTVASSTISKNPLVAGTIQNSTITITSTASLSGLIVEMRIFKAGDVTPTAVKSFTPLSLTAGTPVVLSFDYASPSNLPTGIYTLDIGVWSSDWSHTYLYDSPRSFNVVAGTDTTAPSAPTGLTTTFINSWQLDLSWAASTDNVGVTGYQLERCIGSACTPAAPAIATPVGTTFSDTSVTTNTNVYRYRVRATDAAGNLSGYSAIVTAPSITVATSTISKNPLVAGGTQNATVSITSATALSNLIVNLMIYNASGTLIDLKDPGPLTIAAGGTAAFTYSYVSPSNMQPGTYEFRIGIFGSTWSPTYHYSVPRTFTVVAPAPFTIGETTVLATADSGNGNLLIAQDATLSQTGTIQSLSFYVTTASGNLRLGIYDATGPGGGPGAKKAETNSFTPVVGWNTANVITPVVLSPGTYWLAYLPSSSTLAFRMNPTIGSYKYYGYTFGPMPATYSTTPTSGTTHWSFYATLTP